MYKLKSIKKLTDNIPKKKIIKKVGVFVIKKLVGGTYLDIASLLFKNTKDKAVSYAGTYAYEKFVRSQYAKEHINSIPMIITSLIVRMVINFLIISKLKTGLSWLDFIISISITVIVTILSPFFFTSIEVHKEGFIYYTNIFINNFLGYEYEYMETFKNVILVIISIILIIVLQFVEITSRYIQKIIIHSIITGSIAYLFQLWIDNLRRVTRLYYGITYIPVKSYKLNYIELQYKCIQVCNTKNMKIIGPKSQRALLVSHNKIKKYLLIEMDSEYKSKQKIQLIDIIVNYKIN